MGDLHSEEKFENACIQDDEILALTLCKLATKGDKRVTKGLIFVENSHKTAQKLVEKGENKN